MAHIDEADALILARLENGINMAAGKTEDALHAFLFEGLDYQLAAVYFRQCGHLPRIAGAILASDGRGVKGRAGSFQLPAVSAL
jgi:hypothetical protein